MYGMTKYYRTRVLAGIFLRRIQHIRKGWCMYELECEYETKDVVLPLFTVDAELSTKVTKFKLSRPGALCARTELDSPVGQG